MPNAPDVRAAYLDKLEAALKAAVRSYLHKGIFYH